MSIKELAESLLPGAGAAALDFLITNGADYLTKLLSGTPMTEEEKDDFYAIVDKASRMG